MGFPLSGVLAWGVSLVEVAGGLALIAGLFAVPAALVLSVHQLASLVVVHLGEGFFVVGPGRAGIEFNLVMIAGLVTILLAGPGRASVGGQGRREVAEGQERGPAPGDEQ